MRKGFLFTVTVFLVLTYILLSISVWVKSVETEERAYAEFYKESSLELALEQLTEEKLDNVSQIIVTKSLYRLNMHSIDYPVLGGPPGDENEKIYDSMHSLVMNGSAPGDYFYGGTEIKQDKNASFAGWVDNLNASLSSIGIYVNDFSVDNFVFEMVDYRTVKYSYDLTISMSDPAGTTSLSRTYNIDSEMDISGFVDPSTSRESEEMAGNDRQIYRQFFFTDVYSEYADLEPDKIESIQAGQGWFYGYVVDVSEAAAIEDYTRHVYILSGDYSSIISLENYEEFGAYIVTDAPSTSQAQCGGNEDEQGTFNAIRWDLEGIDCVAELDAGNRRTLKPFVVAPGFSVEDAANCPELWDVGSGNRLKCALIMASYSPEEVREDLTRKQSTPAETGVYDLEEVRDFLMCGYYMQDPEAPSYFQRMLKDSYNRSDSELGISTLVIGEYANSTDYDTYSRLDRELFTEPFDAGIKVRGITGCKNAEMCSDDPTTAIFALTEEAVETLGLEDIACNNGLARCEE